MKEVVRLFKALPVEKRSKEYSVKYMDCGVLVEQSVVEKYTKRELDSAVNDLVINNEQMNKTFYKSWKKIRDADILQLLTEQIIHYFTTYGLESVGLYNEDTIYIPNEALELEEKGGITFFVLNGITKEEMGERMNNLLKSGAALSDEDLTNLVAVVEKWDISVEPSLCKNKEMRVRLYVMLNMTPHDPTEFLRLQVYKYTGKSLLIKSREVIEEIGVKCHTDVFWSYQERIVGALPTLATIFYRYKPLFLAFKNNESACAVNRIQKLAKIHHKPMVENYMNVVTRELRNDTLDADKLNEALGKATVFQKIKLYQALNFYGKKDVHGVVYSVRNGKSYAATTTPVKNVGWAQDYVRWSMEKDLEHLKGKKIFMDANIAVPSSGKMFCGNMPFGSSFATDESLVIGVSWADVGGERIDLDLSMVAVSGKTGWDGSYRNSSFLFSGDITAAPHGATEMHLVRQDAEPGTYLVNLNYYNSYREMPDVPFTLFVAEANEFERMDKESLVSKDDLLFFADSSIDPSFSEKTIGILKIEGKLKTFYVIELKSGRAITARRDEKSVNTIDYYEKFVGSYMRLNELLGRAGAEIVNSREAAEIDLSLEGLTKDKLITMLVGEDK